MLDLRKNWPVVAGTSAFWIVLFIAYALFAQRQPKPQPIEIITDVETTPPTNECAEAFSPTPTVTPAPLRVYVSGAVHSSGVFHLPPDSLVVDAIEQAGGATDDADLVAINLAHPLRDGEHIHVPTMQEESPTPPPITRVDTSTGLATGSLNASSSPLPAKIDLNTASQEELESLPGIGPAMAQRIIEGRPYSQVDDLLDVKGIGEAKLAKIKPYVVVR